MGHRMVKNILYGLAIFALQTLSLLAFTVLAFATEALVIIYVPIINFAIALSFLFLKSKSKSHIICTAFAWLFSFVVCVPLLIFVIIHQSELGFWGIILLRLYGFDVPNFVCIIVLFVKKIINTIKSKQKAIKGETKKTENG